MKKFNVQITYAGMIEETIEAESLEEAEIEADFIAIFEASFNYDEYEINVEEAQEKDTCKDILDRVKEVLGK
ncbi:TPA: hypothetical protein SGT44_000744 [Staphylococcus aureus]|nr:hypothetical protein [Staphylococcus aureus]